MSDDAARVALVTGASRGIGAAIAKRFVDNGFRVAGSATTDGGARRIEDALDGAGIGVVLRLEDEASVAAAIDDVQHRCGAPAVLVNNAGITRDNLLVRMSPEQWDDVLAANLTGLYRLTRPLLRGMMRARWGRIVNLSSVVARMGNAGQSNYAAAKAGIEGFTRALAQEVGARGITVNAVAPGFIDTDMTRALADNARAALVERIALGRMGSVADVAAAAAFLASDGAGYITGETLHVNGGLYSG